MISLGLYFTIFTVFMTAPMRPLNLAIPLPLVHLSGISTEGEGFSGRGSVVSDR